MARWLDDDWSISTLNAAQKYSHVHTSGRTFVEWLSFCLLLTRTRGILFQCCERATKKENTKRRAANQRRLTSRTGRDYVEDTLPSSFSRSVLFKKHLHSREPSLPHSHNWNLYAIVPVRSKRENPFQHFNENVSPLLWLGLVAFHGSRDFFFRSKMKWKFH